MPDAAAPPPREAIRAAARADEGTVLRERIEACGLDAADRARIENRGVALVRRVRSESRPGLMETFLAEYGLSTQEGVALMCLAEALLRTPDAETIDALIEDKIAASDWSAHLGRATSPLVNASTWALMLTGRVLSDDEAPRPPRATSATPSAASASPVIPHRRRAGDEGARPPISSSAATSVEALVKRRRRGKAPAILYSYNMLG
jgi:Proline dehydrogenase